MYEDVRLRSESFPTLTLLTRRVRITAAKFDLLCPPGIHLGKLTWQTFGYVTLLPPNPYFVSANR